MIIYDIPQHIEQDDGTLLTNPEWLELRRGIPSASGASKVITSTGKASAQAQGYLNQLLAERAGYGDEPMEQTEWMARGLELESEAREAFEFTEGLKVSQVGFVTNDDGTAGCSPDGLIETGDRMRWFGWECKCPKPSTHIGYLRAGKIPTTYISQLEWSMAVTSIRSWYFMSYCPGLEPLVLLREWSELTDQTVKAIDKFTKQLEKESQRFGWRKAA